MCSPVLVAGEDASAAQQLQALLISCHEMGLQVTPRFTACIGCISEPQGWPWMPAAVEGTPTRLAGAARVVLMRGPDESA